jgi:hypothetical protein
MIGTLITTSKDTTTGLSYSIYLVEHNSKLLIATFDIKHNMLTQVQEVTLAEEKIPEPIQIALREWLL